MQDDREPPLRYISKREGVRHVLHAAIRSVFYGEDPFAIHLLGQSAEKVLLDLLKHANIEDPMLSMLSLLKPELRSEFFRFYREPYNFLKHADRDSGDKLGVHNIAASNDMLVYLCIVRYRMLFGSDTQHMRVLGPRFCSLYIGWRQNARPSIATPEGEWNKDADGVRRAGHAMASSVRGVIISRTTEPRPSVRRSTAIPSGDTLTR